MIGPSFHAPPNLNHVALSLPAEALDAEGREAILAFYGDVFGWEEYPEMTRDRAQLVMRVHTLEQFVFLVSDDEPMRAPRLDHVGLSVSTVEDFEEVHRRASAWKERLPDEVDLIEPTAEVYVDVLRLHSFYVGYRLPIMVETQHFELLADLT